MKWNIHLAAPPARHIPGLHRWRRRGVWASRGAIGCRWGWLYTLGCSWHVSEGAACKRGCPGRRAAHLQLHLTRLAARVIERHSNDRRAFCFCRVEAGGTCVAPLSHRAASMRLSSPAPQSPRSNMLGAWCQKGDICIKKVSYYRIECQIKSCHARRHSMRGGIVAQGHSSGKFVTTAIYQHVIEVASRHWQTTQWYSVWEQSSDDHLALVPALHALCVVARADLGRYGAPVHIIQHHPLVVALQPGSSDG